jgi:hypothetical protein
MKNNVYIYTLSELWKSYKNGEFYRSFEAFIKNKPLPQEDGYHEIQ